MKKLLLFCVFSAWLIPLAVAQKQVSGAVTDYADRQPLPGVNVLIQGTSLGAVTDIDGNYAIEVPNDDAVLVFSFIGYEAVSQVVGTRSTIDVSLMADIQQLGEVVVTALGIERDKKSLGYALTQVEGESLTQARENNVINSLVGKVAGLNVNSTAGGAGASSNVIIRGLSSLGQSNQPLYVINGIPMSSQPNANPGSQWDNAPDLGDAISNINPDDIESMSVLKGAAATALYGSRGKAGVILITTKSPTGKDHIEFNSNYVAETIIDLTDWQYVYGQGANTEKPATAAEAAQVGGSSWGALLDGSQVVQFDGVERPYTAQKDNLENFYRTGGTWTNTLSFNKGFDGGGLRFSASNMSNNSVVPNSGLDRQTFDLSGTFDISKRLNINARANYILEQAENRPMLSDGAGNANYNVMFLPTSIDVRTLEPAVNPDGSEFQYNSGNAYATNPYFAAHKFVNNTNRNRLMGNFTARYTFDNGLFVQGRAGIDKYTDEYRHVLPSGTAYFAGGKIQERRTQFSEINVDGLVGKSFTVSERFVVTPNLGAAFRHIESNWTANYGETFAMPFVYNLKNATIRNLDHNQSEEETQSLYGTLELAFDDMLFLTVSGRNDWFSTLATPGMDNKLDIFYPSISGSFVFSELLNTSFLTMGKIRAGYATVGMATDPYNTSLSYTVQGFLNGVPLGSVANGNIPNSGLIASEATEFEVGTDLHFLQNRLNLDLTYYNKVSENEILNTPASITSGYTGAVLNSGEMTNKGIEVLLSATPVNTASFSWETSFNFSHNKNKIVSLAGNQEQSTYATSRSGVGFLANVVGMPAGQVMAFDNAYDENGEIVLTPNGIPARGELKAYGSAFHPQTAGWNNQFSFKGLNFGFLIDGKWGGKIFSATDYYGYIFGLHKETLDNREEGFNTPEGNINAATYYSTIANNLSHKFVEDASFIKFRQVTLGYNFPGKFFNDKIQSLSVSLVARNLFFLMRKTDNIDPEGNYSANAQGLELGGVPPVRSYGLNLNIKL